MTLIYIPGLVSDGRVWHKVAELVGDPHVGVDVSTQPSITELAEDALAATSGQILPVGHSMGGRVAIEMARLAPARMRGLVLADTGHHPLAPGELANREAKIALGHKDMAALVEAWLPPMVDPGRRTDAALMDDLREMALSAGPDQHERQIRALIARPNAEPAMRGLVCPVLLLVGASDRWSPRHQHDEIAGMTRDAKVVEIPEAGHFLPAERPDETAHAIRTWMRARGV